MEENGQVLNISVFNKELIIKKLMAYVLDLARISGLNDRQLTQYERSVKNFFYDQVKGSNDALCMYNQFKTTKDIIPEQEPKKDKEK